MIALCKTRPNLCPNSTPSRAPRQPSSGHLADLAQLTILGGQGRYLRLRYPLSEGRLGVGRWSRLWVVSEPRLPRTSVRFPEAQRPPWEVAGVKPRSGLARAPRMVPWEPQCSNIRNS